MNIKEAVYGLKQDIYNLKDFLSDTEKQIWQEAIETILAELEKKDKIIDFIAKWLYEDDTSFGYGKLKEVNTQEKIKEYFKKKVEE